MKLQILLDPLPIKVQILIFTFFILSYILMILAITLIFIKITILIKKSLE